jgi:hypothetical protein
MKALVAAFSELLMSHRMGCVARRADQQDLVGARKGLRDLVKEMSCVDRMFFLLGRSPGVSVHMMMASIDFRHVEEAIFDVKDFRFVVIDPNGCLAVGHG